MIRSTVLQKLFEQCYQFAAAGGTVILLPPSQARVLRNALDGEPDAFGPMVEVENAKPPKPGFICQLCGVDIVEDEKCVVSDPMRRTDREYSHRFAYTNRYRSRTRHH